MYICTGIQAHPRGSVVELQGLRQDGLNSLSYNSLETPIIIAHVHDIFLIDVKSSWWRQKVCHDIKNMSWCQNVCHDIKKFHRDVKNIRHDVKNMLWRQKVPLKNLIFKSFPIIVHRTTLRWGLHLLTFWCPWILCKSPTWPRKK